MMLPLKHVSASTVTRLCFQIIFGCIVSSTSGTGEPDDCSRMSSWICSCASGNSGTEGYPLGANCSSFCNCTLGGVTNQNSARSWICTCSAEGVPRTSYMSNSGCFSSCDCTFGSMEPGKSGTSKHISSKTVVSILLSCILVTTLALLASVACCLFRKETFPVQSPTFSLDSETSVNSYSDLISGRSAHHKESWTKIKFYFSLAEGWMYRKMHMLTMRKDKIPGSITCFSYAELEHATNRFSNTNLIGIGESCKVYRGQLPDGRDVAIKRLKVRKGSHADLEFLTEIEMIARLHHFNIVSLHGYCSVYHGKYSERLQVFEYMSNGNLRCHLDASQTEPLDWAARVGIALGAAKGLEYLHEAAAPRILHRDVKSSNILLDSNRRAKISDLGMAKRMANDDHPSCSSSPARMLGTFGYFAPEYAITGKASVKSDVFSFGVVLLELITGRPPINTSAKRGQESLVIWASSILMDSKRVLKELPDPLLEGNFQELEVLVMSQLVRECLSYDPELRPTMAEVVQILSTITPEKRMRKFSLQYLQSSLTNDEFSGYGSDTDEKNEKRKSQATHGTSKAAVSAELRKGALRRWSGRRSLSSELDLAMLTSSQGDNSEVLMAGYVDRLLLLTSEGHSCRSVDQDEASSVDLTEPRFEKFWEGNVHSL